MGADGSQEDPVTGSGSLVSRRRVLQAAGAAGAAVSVAPVVESFTSYAVAGSAPTTPTPTGPNFGCSWVYVVWEDTAGKIFYTGWQGDKSTACNRDGAYPLAHGHNKPVKATCTAGTFKLEPTSGAPPVISYSGYSGSPGSGSLTSTTSGCGYFTYSGSGGRTIQASTGTTILAAFSFGANKVTAICPNGTGAGNSLSVTCSRQSTISTTG